MVSEALYLADPDGNGIEIYRDRPRSEWPHQNGQLQMATDPLDLNGILAELGPQPAPWTGLAPETVIGGLFEVEKVNQNLHPKACWQNGNSNWPRKAKKPFGRA